MTALRTRFVDELRRLGDGYMLDLQPGDLARATATIVGAAGGGLSLMQPLVRLPIGASDEDARMAEQIQASVGVGPCLESAITGVPLVANEADLSARWPLYHQLLMSRTPFRATLAFPLKRSGGEVFAALDLYSEESTWHLGDELLTVQTEIVDLIAMMLLGAMLSQKDRHAWPGERRSHDRQQIWVAIGMVCEAAGVQDDDAVAMLRAYAFANDLLLDKVADEMMAGRLLPEAVANLE